MLRLLIHERLRAQVTTRTLATPSRVYALNAEVVRVPRAMVAHVTAHYHVPHLDERHRERRAASLDEPHGASRTGRATPPPRCNSYSSGIASLRTERVPAARLHFGLACGVQLQV